MAGLIETNETSELLLNEASANLYRSNAFRILGMPTFSSERQINERVSEILGCIRLDLPFNSGGYLPLSPPPKEDEVMNASQRLRNGEIRLIDEIFWFWPLSPNDPTEDKALIALEEGDYEGARYIWLKNAGECENKLENTTSAHNLAVLAHVKALDTEFSLKRNWSNVLDLSTKWNLWNEAYHWWGKCLDNQELMAKILEQRIKELDYANLRVDTARKFISTLPSSIIAINVSLALHESEQGRGDQAKEHLHLIQSSNLIGAKIEVALSGKIKSISEQIKSYSTSSVIECQESPDKGFEIALRMTDKAETYIAALDALLNSENSVLKDAHDTVANSVVDIQIYFARKTYNWIDSLKLLELALTISRGYPTRNRIQTEMAKVTEFAKRSAVPVKEPPPSAPFPAKGEGEGGDLTNEINEIAGRIRGERKRRYETTGGILGAIGGSAISIYIGGSWIQVILALIIGYAVTKKVGGKIALLRS